VRLGSGCGSFPRIPKEQPCNGFAEHLRDESSGELREQTPQSLFKGMNARYPHVNACPATRNRFFAPLNAFCIICGDR